MSEPVLVVRRVLSVDLRGATELLQEKQRAEQQKVDPEALRRAVQAILEDSDRTLVAGAYHVGLPGFAHGKLVGVLIMHVYPSLAHAGEVGWIEELYVRGDYRRKGLGERLLSQALEWSAGRGLRALDLEVGQTRTPEAAERLYFKKGFRRIQSARLKLASSPEAPIGDEAPSAR